MFAFSVSCYHLGQRACASLALLLLLLLPAASFGQGVAIGHVASVPHSSALLDVISTSKGVLIPRMTLTQRNAIVSPATGLLVYQTSGTAGFYYNAGIPTAPNWKMLGEVSPAGQWSVDGQNMFYTGGYIGIGTSTPTAPLHVLGTNTGGGNVLFTGSFKSTSPGDPPAQYGGTRMMWYADKAAFRVGQVTGEEWNTNFIGNHSFAAGLGSIASGTASVALGRNHSASGNYSTALGEYNTMTGQYSTGIGSNNNVTGNYGTAIGSANVVSGSYSMAFGRGLKARSMSEVVVGLYNTDYTPSSATAYRSADRLFVIGNGLTGEPSNALVVLKSGRVGIGTDLPEFRLHVEGSDIMVRGHRIGIGGGSGLNNVVMGRDAMALQMAGDYNVAIGVNALREGAVAHYNTAVGHHALLNNQGGHYNVAVGAFALGMTNNLDPMVSNVAIGYRAGGKLTTGYGNILIGEEAGMDITTGYDNVWIGKQIGASGGPYTVYNTVRIGTATAVIQQNNMVRLGNASMSWIGGQVGWSHPSDARFKRDVKADVPGLDFIMQLKPVSFHWDIDGMNRHMGVEDPYQGPGHKDIEAKRMSGFLAQEVEAAARTIGYDFSGISIQDEVYTLTYSEFVMPLVKAVQEQQALIRSLLLKVEELEEKVQQMDAGR